MNVGESLAPGQRVGPYTIESALGIGSLGVSYRARNVEGEIVVLKYLRSAAPLSDREKLRIGREFEALAGLNNPFLPDIIEFVAFRDDYAIITEYQRLGDLGGRLARGPLSPETALALMRHLASAVGEAHAAGVVHGGITPANVLRRSVDGRQVPLLVDFGIALRSHAWTPPEHAPDVSRYRAPELDAGRRMSVAGDVFALGSLLAVMVGPQAPRGIRELVARATDPRPRRRYRDGRRFHDALVEAMQEPWGALESMPAQPPATVPEGSVRQRPKEPSVLPRPDAARLLTEEAVANVGSGYQSKAKLIGGIMVAALVVLVLSVMFSGPKGSIFGGATHTPPAPVVLATPSYRSVLFNLQQPPGDASVVEVRSGTMWTQVGADTYTLPTAKGGVQACADFRVVDASQSPPLVGPQVTACGTSVAPTLTAQRVSPDCRYRGASQVCYSVMASGLEPGTSGTMVLRLDGQELRKVAVTVDKSGHATLPDGDYFHFTSASAGKTADLTYMGLEYAWTVDKRQ